MNHFLPMIRDGRIVEETDLKRVFWTLAAKLHPDTASKDVDGEAFIRLRRDYEEALAEIRPGSGPAMSDRLPDGDFRKSVARFDPVDFLDLLEELVAGGLPVDPSVRSTNAFYLRRLERMNDVCRAPGTPFSRSFLEMEQDYYRIRGDNIILYIHMEVIIRLLELIRTV